MTLKISRSQVFTQPNPAHGWTQPMPNSEIHVAKIQVVSTGIRIQVARPGYLYPATCIGCKRGFMLDGRMDGV